MRTTEERAAGAALLFHVSPRGGSYGESIDLNRAKEVAQTITGPELLALLIDAAQRSTEEMRRETKHYRRMLIMGARQVAEAADSLALHRFVERYAEENAQ